MGLLGGVFPEGWGRRRERKWRFEGQEGNLNLVVYRSEEVGLMIRMAETVVIDGLMRLECVSSWEREGLNI